VVRFATGKNHIMHKVFTLLLLVAQVLAVGVAVARAPGSPLAASAATLGRATPSGAVVYAPSKSRSTAAPMVALRVSRASRTLTWAAAPARPHDAESRRAVVSGRTRSALPPPPLVLRI
jgi:hypothetical protein